MALPIETLERISQARAELAPFQDQLTDSELFRASAVFERAAHVWVDGFGNPKGVKIENNNGSHPIFRIDNQANSVQRRLTILLERHEDTGGEAGAETVLLGAVATDQLDQAVEEFVKRGYEFNPPKEVVLINTT